VVVMRGDAFQTDGLGQPFQQFMYNRLLLCCPLPFGDVIFASVSDQCPQGPPI
jgi:hypothetical protein